MSNLYRQLIPHANDWKFFFMSKYISPQHLSPWLQLVHAFGHYGFFLVRLYSEYHF